MNINRKFSARSREVAGRFLHSAVIVDDQARLSREVVPPTVIEPGRGPRDQTSSKPPLSQSGPGAATHDLDAKELIDSFADLGIVCAVLKPYLESSGTEAGEPTDTIESLTARTDEATKRADIVILDWNIPYEARPGQNARNLIKNILSTDDPSSAPGRTDGQSRRRRLIAIYTGDEDLELITREMGDFLEELDLGGVTRTTYRVTAGPVTIVVYGKGKPTITGDDAERRVGEKDLPERLRDEFSLLTEGLLSNAALEALSAIRTNTHRILSRFHSGVDAPYVAHRAMMQPPGEAEEHPVPLIASEIEGVLADDAKISELVGLEVISEWLEHVMHQDEVDQLEMSTKEFKIALMSLLDRGLDRARKPTGHMKWKTLIEDLKNYNRAAASTITDALSRDGVDGATLDMEFARLTSLRSQYEAPAPTLKLGSIVATQEKDGPTYLLCIQPLCDSVRLSRPRKFTFLKLKEVPAGGDNQFDLVVADEDVHKRLYVSRKIYDIVLIDMEPDASSKSVRAKQAEGGRSWQFQQAEGESPIRWIADLKPEFAQRVVNEFTSHVARVGLTESEWLRRMATKTRFP